jgi:hypothetical protein
MFETLVVDKLVRVERFKVDGDFETVLDKLSSSSWGIWIFDYGAWREDGLSW